MLRLQVQRVSANPDAAARRRRAQRVGGSTMQYATAHGGGTREQIAEAAAPTTHRSRDIRSRDAAESCAYSEPRRPASAQTTGGRFNWK